jgi:hypothetical protein
MAIARDGEVATAIHGEFQELVVCRIAALRDPLGDRHHLCCRQQLRQPITCGSSNQRRKVRPIQDFEELSLGGVGFERVAALRNQMERESEPAGAGPSMPH